MEKRQTILIFGISSFLGSNFAEFFKKDYRVLGTYHKHPIYIEGVLSLPCDVLNKDQVQFMLFSIKPDIVIYAVGLSSVFESAKALQLADTVNTMGALTIAENCQRYRSKFILISSGHIFGGINKLYSEADLPDALTHYGKTKASAEFFIQRNCMNYLIFRCCPLYGYSINPQDYTFIESLQSFIQQGENMVVDNNVFEGFLDVYYLAMLILLVLKKGAVERLFQVSSADQKTFFDFAKLYCSVFKLPDQFVRSGQWPHPISVSTTSNYSGGEIYYRLSVKNISTYLKIKIPTIEESLKFTYNRLNGIEGKSKKKEAGIVFI